MTERTLPRTIRPRVLKRTKGVDGYVTSDGRYEVLPARFGVDRRVRFWTARDLRDSSGSEPRQYPDLDAVRSALCAPYGKVPWLVCDMDQGVLRVEPTRNEAVRWAAIFFDADEWRHSRGGICHEYFFGPENDYESVFIVQADNAHRGGFDPEQQPLHPFADDPYEEVARPEPTATEAQ
ncbi:hypothetical protein ACWGQT_07305 [Streptomyces yangpuensis]